MTTTRRPRPTRNLTALSGLILALAGVPAGAQTNPGLDASQLPFVSCNGRVAFRMSELSQNATDVTGDGDALDFPLWVIGMASGSATGVFVDAPGPLACGGDLVAVGVSEAGENADLNGDLDLSDVVLHVYDANTGILTNTGRAVAAVFASPALVAFTVDEAAQGTTDLNGDGDKADRVLHVYDPALPPGPLNPRNVGREAGAAGDAGNIVLSGLRVAFLAREADEGSNLNGDPDFDDDVLQLFDAGTGTLTNVARQAQPNPGIRFEGDVVAFSVSEREQGGQLLNGDVDAADVVAHVYCLSAPACGGLTGVVNLGIDASGHFELGGDLLAIGVRERNQGRLNLNAAAGDLDTQDTVLHVYRLSSGAPATQIVNTGLAIQGSARIVGDDVVFVVPERRQARINFNAAINDYDSRDLVLHRWNAVSLAATNLGLAVHKSCPLRPGNTLAKGPCFTAGGDVVVAGVSEKSHGPTVLNGDGDVRDIVLATYRLSTGAVTNLGLATDQKSAMLASGDLAVFRVSERDQGAGLNPPDIDLSDFVIGVRDVAAGVTTVLPFAADIRFTLDGTHLVFRTPEGAQGANLNGGSGDGDLFDAVLLYETF